MQKDFKLETILTGTTGITLVDDFTDFYELVWFMFNDPLINDSGLLIYRDQIKGHLLSLYPELEEVGTVPKEEILKNKWLDIQKAKFGEYLPVCQIGEKLEGKKEKVKTK